MPNKGAFEEVGWAGAGRGRVKRHAAQVAERAVGITDLADKSSNSKIIKRTLVTQLIRHNAN